MYKKKKKTLTFFSLPGCSVSKACIIHFSSSSFSVSFSMLTASSEQVTILSVQWALLVSNWSYSVHMYICTCIQAGGQSSEFKGWLVKSTHVCPYLRLSSRLSFASSSSLPLGGLLGRSWLVRRSVAAWPSYINQYTVVLLCNSTKVLHHQYSCDVHCISSNSNRLLT